MFSVPGSHHGSRIHRAAKMREKLPLALDELSEARPQTRHLQRRRKHFDTKPPCHSWESVLVAFVILFLTGRNLWDSK